MSDFRWFAGADTISYRLVESPWGIGMLGKFWESAGDKLAERWLDISMSALVFWLGGLIGWTYSRGGLTQLANSERWLTRLPTTAQVAVLLVALAAASPDRE